MAENIFRITPRVSQVIHAIEEFLQTEEDKIPGSDAGTRRVVVNTADFRFDEVMDEMIFVHVVGLEMAYVLPDDPDLHLCDQRFVGSLRLQKMRVQRVGRKDFVYYKTVSVNLQAVPAAGGWLETMLPYCSGFRAR